MYDYRHQLKNYSFSNLQGNTKKMHMNVQNKHFVVTGGGSGIGRSICLHLLSKNARVSIWDVNVKGMEETLQLAGAKSDKVSLHTVNVSNRAEVEAAAQILINSTGGVDGIINNAGIIQPFIPVKDLTYEQIERVLNINLYGTIYMVKTFLPHLLTRPEAHIVNIASMGGFIPFPGQTMYSASKAAVKLLTEGLYAELLETKVGVSLVMPGAVNTNIMANSGLEPIKATAQQQANILSPDKAAELVVEAIEKNTPRVLAGSDARFLDLFYRFMPMRSIRFIVSKMKQI